MDDTIQLALETIAQKKQAIVFCASRASAEKTAEDIASKLKADPASLNDENKNLAEEVLKAINPPTKQCKRLSKTLSKKIAFHHSGLHSKQKELIEDEFRAGNIHIICATPTLAAGLSLPVFRVICKSLKRYSGRFGMDWIPTLEYMQMAGRAGRPEYEDFGEAIAIATNDGQKEEIFQRYIQGEPEDIYSKLNVEPVLRMYLLSLIATGIIKDTKQMQEFFEKTFWAQQFGDMDELNIIMQKMLKLLREWGFIIVGEEETESFKDINAKESKEINKNKLVNNLFTSALDIARKNKIETKNEKIFGNKEIISLRPTMIGRRISELYLDPLTANQLIIALNRSQEWLLNPRKKEDLTSFSYLQIISNTLEMFPGLRIKSKEQEYYNQLLLEYYDNLLQDEPDVFSLDYGDFINSIKTTDFFLRWIDEVSEDELLEELNIRPGEIRVKLENANWLIYSCIELAKVLDFKEQISKLERLRTRVKYGVKEELLTLMKLKGVGRNRARKLYQHKFKTVADLKRADQADLQVLLGPSLAASIKEQLGQEVIPIKKGTRKGQLSLGKFNKD